MSFRLTKEIPSMLGAHIQLTDADTLLAFPGDPARWEGYVGDAALALDKLSKEFKGQGFDAVIAGMLLLLREAGYTGAHNSFRKKPAEDREKAIEKVLALLDKLAPEEVKP